MATRVPVVGQTFTFGCSAVSQADTDIFKAAATIAAGDFKRSINGGDFANMDNLPTVTPAAGKRIQFVVSAAETTTAGDGGEIYIVGSDQADSEWQDFAVILRVCATDIPVTGADGDTLKSISDQIDTVDANVDLVLADTGTDGVLLSVGTGAKQLDVTGGVVKANLAQILGTALTETAGQIAAAFKKFFNVATPTGTVNSVPDAVAGAAGGLAIVGSAMVLTGDYDAAKTAAQPGADGDTLETLSDQLDAVGSVAGMVL